MTVRRDLQALADQGKVIRTHGGAAMAERVSFEFEFLNRVQRTSGRQGGDRRGGRGTDQGRRVGHARFGHHHAGTGQAAAREAAD